MNAETTSTRDRRQANLADLFAAPTHPSPLVPIPKAARSVLQWLALAVRVEWANARDEKIVESWLDAGGHFRSRRTHASLPRRIACFVGGLREDLRRVFGLIPGCACGPWRECPAFLRAWRQARTGGHYVPRTLGMMAALRPTSDEQMGAFFKREAQAAALEDQLRQMPTDGAVN